MERELSGDNLTNEPRTEYDPRQASKATAELMARLIEALHENKALSSDAVLMLFHGEYDEVPI